MSKAFLYKENSEDRDCCAYIEDKPMRFVCGHYFSGVILQGSCYSGHDFAEYTAIKTVLTEEEYKALLEFSESINDLGYGITEGDERYNKGIDLCNKIQPVYDKLLSTDNVALFEEVQEEEKEFLMNEYGLDETEIEDIFDNYYLEYRDRSVVSAIYNDASDLGYEEAESLGYMNNDIQARYFDYEKFGEDLVNEEWYHRLEDGRVVRLSY